MTSNRPDFSDYLVHFTKEPSGKDGNVAELPNLKSMSALDRLLSILISKNIVASDMNWKVGKAVCFTECPWASLLQHAGHYSKFGLGFKKARIFAAGGSPVFYVRPDHFKKQDWASHIRPFVTPFWPFYRDKNLDENVPKNMRKPIDFSHEREWRIPHTFTFEYENIEFVILPDYDAMASFPKGLKDAIGREKFLLMEQYETVEKIWPVHKL